MTPNLNVFLNSDDRTTGGIRGQNRYSYAYNNPMSFIDPDGRSPRRGNRMRRAFAAIPAAVLSGGSAAYRYLRRVKSPTLSHLPDNVASLERNRLAAVTIQQHMRGFLVRNRYLNDYAANIIQMHVYGFLLKKRYQKTSNLYTPVIESFMRRARELGVIEEAYSSTLSLSYARKLVDDFRREIIAQNNTLYPIMRLMQRQIDLNDGVKVLMSDLNFAIQSFGHAHDMSDVMAENIGQITYVVTDNVDVVHNQANDWISLLLYNVRNFALLSEVRTMFPRLWDAIDPTFHNRFVQDMGDYHEFILISSPLLFTVQMP